MRYAQPRYARIHFPSAPSAGGVICWRSQYAPMLPDFILQKRLSLRSSPRERDPWAKHNQAQSRTIKNNQEQSRTIKNNQEQSRTIKNNQTQ
jgi:hypothetical protein